MLPPDLQLESERLLLRPLERENLPTLLELTQDPALWTYFTHDLSTLAGLEAWAAGHFAGDRLQFVVVDKGSQQYLGSTGFGNYFPREQRIEIGWTWLGRAAQGTGTNREMKSLMLAYAFEELGMLRVEFKTDVLNLPARKALLRLGATEEGILRSHTLMTHGRRRDTIYYSFLKGENWLIG
uniref:GNAT family N-acetyltransferase n=1 Tax=Algoriphagus sp. TaxID=1872435 RepID=UPI004047B39F